MLLIFCVHIIQLSPQPTANACLIKPISASTRSPIVSLLLSGHSTRAVAAQTGVSQSTVSNIARKEFVNRQYCSAGRPRLVTSRLERRIVRMVETGEVNTAVEVKQQLETTAESHVSTQTVRRILKRNGMRSRVKPKKPLLRPRHRRQRLEFAQKYRNWTVDDWRRVVWSYETKINLFGSDGRQYCWRMPGKRLQWHHVKPTVKHGGGSLMMWGCMTAQGVGHACRIDGNMDSTLYQNILADELLGTLDWYGLQRDNIVFQHDNDPKHTARTTRQWLVDNAIEVLDWPPQSPDLNPIEHLWYHVKEQLAGYDERAKGVHQMWERVEEVWETIDPNLCLGLIESMSERVAAVLEAKGGYTKW